MQSELASERSEFQRMESAKLALEKQVSHSSVMTQTRVKNAPSFVATWNF